MTGTHRTLLDELRDAHTPPPPRRPPPPLCPSPAIALVPASPETVPVRMPEDAWGLVVIGARAIDTDAPADPELVDAADLLAGVWLPEQPPADVHSGDLVVRLHPPADGAADRVDVEVLAAHSGAWHTMHRRESLGVRWPHHLIEAVLWHMRGLNLGAFLHARWIAVVHHAATLPPAQAAALLRIAAGKESCRSARDALSDLVGAGLVTVGDTVRRGGRTAIVTEGGVLRYGPGPYEVSTVNELAGEVEGCLANGWYLWRRVRDDRPLAALRTELITG
ncbi:MULTISPECIES: hypothetical protein [Actinosynnema]|uniref:hypothetical protein n=1 Tax=Actinosynnema TaxID=40566 RepID=UPI0020A38D92|nr:hypothetical protein [Actinosynnema pretiosum]MCP2094696.1 hypothetical protein [Actinosynnema pretiosum]